MDIKQEIEKILVRILDDLDIQNPEVILEHPADISHGDYSTNIAMKYAKILDTNPKDLAQNIIEKIGTLPYAEVNFAFPGFINFSLSSNFFKKSLKTIVDQKDSWGDNTLFKNKKVIVEYTQPNPFKPFHIGHLMSNSIGESISRLIEHSGAKIIRANYQGDVGLHVAKSLWGIINRGKPDETLSITEQSEYIGACYSYASGLCEDDENVKIEIDTINKKVYSREDESINALYDWGRAITLEAFESIYSKLGTKFDYYFFESEMAKIGEDIVRANIPNIFEESSGAIVFKADKYDPKLHTRVFISSLGLPMYETKEIGLTITKFQKENPDLSITTTAIEQGEYMKVVTKAIEQINPKYSSKMKHITHGMMRLSSGKMSSRKGNIVTGESLIADSLDVVMEKIKDRDFSPEEKENISRLVGVSALKYSILRSGIGSDIVYDFDKSVSFEGDSGPYLQYSVVRANNILLKARNFDLYPKYSEFENKDLSSLEKYLYRFPEIVHRALEDFQPHHIVSYLTELAGYFNQYYASNQVIVENDKEGTEYRLLVVLAFSITMKNGLNLLGIQVPDKM